LIVTLISLLHATFNPLGLNTALYVPLGIGGLVDRSILAMPF